MQKANKLFKVLGIFFFLIGLFYMVIYVGSNFFIDKVANRVKTEAIVEKVTKDGIDIVYTVEGKEYHIRLNEDTDDYHEGMKVKVYYDKNNHKDAFTISFLDDISALVDSVIFIVIGLILLIKYHKNNKIYKRLKENGTLVSARIVNISKSGYSSYIINCEFDGFDGKIYQYKSEPLNFNPADILNYKGMNKIPVYVDMSDLKYYYVDVSSLRK